ncbi:MAG: FAD-dependent oxidoreductase, partial [Oscillospiraceae bacterium]|nr:FAD-dependent oxidoreductase [Oscillospiraceae bacterium]
KYAAPEALTKKKVRVVGGGVGGMEAAITCRARGHEVILCEKGDRLGGGIRCEEFVPFKKYVDVYLNRQAAKVEKAGVDIRLNTEVTPEYAAELGVDTIIAALGSKAIKPPIPGIDGENVLGAEYA